MRQLQKKIFFVPYFVPYVTNLLEEPQVGFEERHGIRRAGTMTKKRGVPCVACMCESKELIGNGITKRGVLPSSAEIF